MATEARIVELGEKHRKLKLAIEEEIQHPGLDSLHLTELKRQKLHVKDEISRLQQDVTTH